MTLTPTPRTLAVVALLAVLTIAPASTTAVTTGIGTSGVQDASSSATVTFESQTSDGTVVTISRANLPDGGFVAVHDAGLQRGSVLDSAIGVSAYLDPGVHDDVTVHLDEPIDESASLSAVAYRDTDGDGEYDFVSTGGEEDDSYLDGNEVVMDDASVTVERETTTPDGTTTEFTTWVPTVTATTVDSVPTTATRTQSPPGTTAPRTTPPETTAPRTTEYDTSTPDGTNTPTGTTTLLTTTESTSGDGSGSSGGSSSGGSSGSSGGAAGGSDSSSTDGSSGANGEAESTSTERDVDSANATETTTASDATESTTTTGSATESTESTDDATGSTGEANASTGESDASSGEANASTTDPSIAGGERRISQPGFTAGVALAALLAALVLGRRLGGTGGE